MFKLKSYLKPFIFIMAIELVLLFSQAIIELNLPKYMSEIVNVGLQQGGIESSAPEVIDEASYFQLQGLMSKENFEIIEKAYTLITDTSTYESQYPQVTHMQCYALTAEEDLIAEVEYIISQTTYGISQLISLEGEEALFSLGEEEIAQIEQLGSADEDSATLVGVYFVKGVYETLGVDLEQVQMNAVYRIGLWMVGLTFAAVICAVGVSYFASKVGAGVARNLRKDVFEKVTSFTGTELDQFSTASLITRTTNDITQLQQFLTMGLRLLCFAPVMGIGGLVLAVQTAPSMTWILAVGTIAVLVIVIFLLTFAMPKFKLIQILVDKLNLVTRENLTGMMVIRAFATQKYESERFDKANKELTNTNLFANRALGFMMPVMTFIMNALMLLVVWVGAKEISQSQILVGDMMAFMQYAMEVVFSFLMVSMILIMIPRASVSATRIYEVLSTTSSIVDSKEPQTFEHKPQGVIRFEDVSFRYTGAKEDVLEHITFTAVPGETTAFIGSTGSGKTTLVNLLPRFYDVTKGCITIDGVDIRQLSQKELRDYIGYVPQKGILFRGDITSNLKFGDEFAQQEQLEEAVDIAQATAFIKEKPDGFSTLISQGGSNVSGGQRQRLSIARALVKKAPIYIFDDSFSALDFKTDAALRKSLAEQTNQSTMLIVAQRISTIMQAEQIIVLDEGKIMGKGTHKQLLDTCETYREIALSQLSKEELGL